jgi:hypothetical protein
MWCSLTILDEIHMTTGQIIEWKTSESVQRSEMRGVEFLYNGIEATHYNNAQRPNPEHLDMKHHHHESLKTRIYSRAV